MRKQMKTLVLTVSFVSLSSAPITALAKVNPQSKGKAGSATRTEHDLLGEKQVPADALYGVQTARALENFQISGIAMDKYPEFIDAFVMVKVVDGEWQVAD